MAGSIGIKVKGNGTVNATTGSGTSQASGSTFVGFATHTDGTPPITVNDNKSNPNFTQIGTSQNASGGAGSTLWRLYNGTGGAGHTFTASTSSFVSLFVIELIGVDTVSVVDATTLAQIQRNASPYTVQMAAANAQADEIIVACMVDNSAGTSTFAESTGFTIQQSETDGSSWFPGCIATKIVSSSAQLTASFTDAAASSAGLFIVGFKITAGAAASARPNLLLLGVG